jgi:hypothetical protein
MDGHFQKVCGIRHECLRHVIPTDACEKCGMADAYFFVAASIRSICWK